MSVKSTLLVFTLFFLHFPFFFLWKCYNYYEKMVRQPAAAEASSTKRYQGNLDDAAISEDISQARSI